ncbi:unnamed protein product [Pseudo-nitzschia multistriata]|uniref:Sulfotransferase domain-containing protein n=1 Tax=Pseudo-nitzschia multistriata TaxID=183589 RepID=A0A448Z0X4_9STRA|nr:unnamed protein product [Pseudo-nitzschia multistriata]
MGGLTVLKYLLLLVVALSATMLVIQMHVLEHHVSAVSSHVWSPSHSSPIFLAEGRKAMPDGRNLKKRDENENDNDNGNENENDNESGGGVDDDDNDDRGDENGSAKDPNGELGDVEFDIDTAKDIEDDLKPILKILEQGGYDVSEKNKGIDRSKLPRWSEVLAAYGPPRVVGLEFCQHYRDVVPPHKRNMAPAGMFNSGTNLLAQLLHANCDFSLRSKVLWQPIWGKHFPGNSRTNHTISFKKPGQAKLYRDKPYHTTLPVVSIRDPYTWMQSMCRQNYAAQFAFAKDQCPNIIPYPSDIKAHPRYGNKKYVPVNVKYTKGWTVHHESLVHVWNEWYQSYLEFEGDDGDRPEGTLPKLKAPEMPYVMVRMEDLVFHGPTVVPQLCECAGSKYLWGNNTDLFRHTSTVANANHGIDVSAGMDTGLLRSIVKYGNIANRRIGYPANQLEAVKELLDPRMMDILGYTYEEP